MIARVALIAGAAAALASATVSGASAIPSCSPARLQLRVLTQGDHTGALIAVAFSTRGAACALRDMARFAVLVRGHRAHIRGNPVTLHGSGIVRPGHIRSLLAYSSNWCGPQTGMSFRVLFARRTIAGRFNTLPACLQPHESDIAATGAVTD